jgi:hypothetical protein
VTDYTAISGQTDPFNALSEPFVLRSDPQELPPHRGSGHLIRSRSDNLGARSKLPGG